MEELRQSWGVIVQDILSWLAGVWAWFARGVLQDWDVRIFIFAMAVILLSGLFSVWRKKI